MNKEVYQMAVHERSKRRAQGLTEFALILPILLFFIMGLIDFGRVLFTYAQASTQLRSALRLASVVGYSSPVYLDCDLMRNTASATFFTSSNSVNIDYRLADSYVPGTGLYASIYPDPLAGTHNCTGDAAANSALATVVNNGDILRMSNTITIQMMTPFLPQTLTFTVAGQRTLVTQVSLINAPYGGSTSLPATQTKDAADFFTQMAGGTSTAVYETAVYISGSTNTAIAVMTNDSAATATWNYWGTLGVTPTPTLTPIWTYTPTPTFTASPTPVLGTPANLRFFPGGAKCTGNVLKRFIGLQWDKVIGVQGYYIYANGLLVGKTTDKKGAINKCGSSRASYRVGRVSGCYDLDATSWVSGSTVNYQVAAFKFDGAVIGPLSNVFTYTC